MDNIDKFVIWIIQFTYDFLVGPWILLREYVDLIFFVFFFWGLYPEQFYLFVSEVLLSFCLKLFFFL